MKLSSYSSTHGEFEFRTDYYHGKDIVHEGCLLILDKEKAWSKIPSKVRNKIRQAEKIDGCTIKRVKGTKANVALFRSIWFDPKDVTIPEELSSIEYFYLCYIKKELVGGLILTPVGSNLFMHNLGSTEEGKKNNIPSLLLWHAVKELEKTGYKYIDVGVSFRKNLYSFFQNWQTDTYPIIFEKPFVKPHISLFPFTNNDIKSFKRKDVSVDQDSFKSTFGDKFTILPRGISCIKALLIHLNLDKTSNVAVYNTFDTEYLSKCVSETIEDYCKISRKINSKTAAVMVIHEFGYPCKETINLRKCCNEKKIPLIENCAWGIKSRIDDKHVIGEVGDYAIYSLPKIFPMQYGGILKGIEISDDENWSKYRMLDYYKKEIVKSQLSTFVSKIDEFNKIKLENWNYLNSLFVQDGYSPLSSIEKNVFPTAYVVKMPEFQEVYERLLEFGVESGRYYHEKSLFLPCHQSLDKEALDYIYAVFRGRLNLCITYKAA